MKRTRLLFMGAMILVLITAACAAEEGTTPTGVGTSFPSEETSTAESTETATAEETATEVLETPTLSLTEPVSTLPTLSGTQTSGTPGIPVTGADIVLVEYQFCVDTMAHALLVLPDTATFEITSPPASTTTSSTSVTATTPICTTVEVNNGRQVVLCSGPEMTPLTLNICTDANTCTDFPVDLLACPLVQSSTAVPNQTQSATGTATGSPTATPTP
jgi:hypothetical protein